MKRSALAVLGSITLVVTLTLIFQNCSEPLPTTTGGTGSSSSNSTGTTGSTGGIPIPPPGPIPQPNSTTPTGISAGYGCDNNYCLWFAGKNLDAHVAIELLKADGSTLADPVPSYSGADISFNYKSSDRSGDGTLALRPNSAEIGWFATHALGLRIRNIDSGSVSPLFVVNPPSPRTPPVPTTAANLDGGPGCDDNYCLWINGDHFDPVVSVEIFKADGSDLAASTPIYSGSELVYSLDYWNTAGKASLTLRLRDSSPERAWFATQPIGFRIRNEVSHTLSALRAITPPAR